MSDSDLATRATGDIAVLLLGRTPFDRQQVQRELGRPGVAFAFGTTIHDVREAFDAGAIDMVIMGAGIPLDQRLAIIEHVHTVSEATTVHMKDRASGREGMTPFVARLLDAFSEPVG